MGRWRPALRLGCLLLLGIVVALWPRARLVHPPSTLLLVDRRGEFLGEVGAPPEGDVGCWELPAVGARLERVTLAAEDRRFHWHPGVDPVAILRALWQNLSSGRRISGASTLAMQVARMQDPGERTLGRKLIEAATALLLTARHGRGAVLRQYLRLAPYGNRVRGIGYAARRYFQKPVEDLTWAELALLTALPQAPAAMNLLDPAGRRRAGARAARILEAVGRAGWLGDAELWAEMRRLEGLAVTDWDRRPAAALHPVLHLQARLEDRRRFPRHPGRELVRSTLDLDLQVEAQRMVAGGVFAWKARGVGNAALMVVDRHDHTVRAAVGSAGYFDTSRAGSIDFTRTPRSSGSTLKPFLYAHALDLGRIGPATILDDLRRAPGAITNADDRFLGPLLPRVALANSRNVPAVQLMLGMGMDETYRLLGELGLHDGRGTPEHYGAGLGIGTLPVTLEDLMGAYTALAGDGVRHPLRWLEDEPPGETRHVLSAESAQLVALWLSDPAARQPSFRRHGNLEFPFPVAVKTGTSSRGRDAWCVGFSRDYLVGAWVGHPDHHPMADGVGGSGPAAFLVKGALSWLHQEDLDGLRDTGFPPPPGTLPVMLCARTGARATAACDRVVREYFPALEVPEPTCTAHQRVAVDGRTGRLASADTPGEFLELRTRLTLPPRYAEWVASQGLEVTPERPHQPTGVAARRLTIVEPEDGVRIRIDPEAPPGASTLALGAVADPSPARLLWLVDGQPLAEVERPFALRWRLEPGEHTFQVQVPWTREVSSPVKVQVLP